MYCAFSTFQCIEGLGGEGLDMVLEYDGLSSRLSRLMCSEIKELKKTYVTGWEHSLFHFSRIHFLFGIFKRRLIFFFLVIKVNIVFMAAKKYRVDYFFLSFHLELDFIGRVWYYPCYEASDREHNKLEHKHKSEAGGE